MKRACFARDRAGLARSVVGCFFFRPKIFSPRIEFAPDLELVTAAPLRALKRSVSLLQDVLLTIIFHLPG